MARKVIWSEGALARLEQISEFITRDSPHYASLTVSRILARLEQAAEFPLSGRLVPELQDENMRELWWRSYRIIYRVKPDAIIVMGVIHGSQDWRGFQ